MVVERAEKTWISGLWVNLVGGDRAEAEASIYKHSQSGHATLPTGLSNPPVDWLHPSILILHYAVCGYSLIYHRSPYLPCLTRFAQSP